MLVYRSVFYLLFSSHSKKNTPHQSLQRLRQQTARQEDNAENSAAPSTSSTSEVPAIQHQADGELEIVKPKFFALTVKSDNTRKPGILCSFLVVNSNASLRSADNVTCLLKKMLHDGTVAQSYASGKTKTMYLIKFKLAEYLKQVFLKSAYAVDYYVASYDESMSCCTKTNQ